SSHGRTPAGRPRPPPRLPPKARQRAAWRPVPSRLLPPSSAFFVRPADAPLSALSVLHELFGYAAFRDAQAEIVEHVNGGGDALVLMPTGGGKSLCYQVPA